MFWEATEWISNEEKLTHVLDIEGVLQGKTEVYVLGKVTVCAVPERWMKEYDPIGTVGFLRDWTVDH